MTGDNSVSSLTTHCRPVCMSRRRTASVVISQSRDLQPEGQGQCQGHLEDNSNQHGMYVFCVTSIARGYLNSGHIYSTITCIL